MIRVQCPFPNLFAVVPYLLLKSKQPNVTFFQCCCVICHTHMYLACSPYQYFHIHEGVPILLRELHLPLSESFFFSSNFSYLTCTSLTVITSCLTFIKIAHVPTHLPYLTANYFREETISYLRTPNSCFQCKEDLTLEM